MRVVVGHSIATRLLLTLLLLVLLLMLLFLSAVGIWTSLRPIILTDLFGIDNLTQSLGWLAMFQGIAFITGPAVIAWLYDTSRSYLWPMVSMALCFFLSGICSLMLQPLKAYRDRIPGLWYDTGDADWYSFHDVLRKATFTQRHCTLALCTCELFIFFFYLRLEILPSLVPHITILYEI